MGIENREPAGPHALREVDRIGDRGIREPLVEGQQVRVGHAAALVRHGEGDRARRGDEHEQRELLQHRAHEPRAIEGPGRGRARGRESPERPVVEQEQREGQRHGDRLGEEPKGQAQCHDAVGAKRRALGVARPGEHPEHPEDARECVRTRRHPGHRLHVQRVDGEDRGNERAPPHRPRHAHQRGEKQQRGERVENCVREQEPGRLEPVELVVQLEGDRCERHPAPLECAMRPSASMCTNGEEGLGEGQRHVFGREARAQVGVVGDVVVVVVPREVVLSHRVEDGGNEPQQRQRNEPSGAGRAVASGA